MAPHLPGWILICGLCRLGDRLGSPLLDAAAISFAKIWPVVVLVLLILAALGIGLSRWRIASIQNRNRQLALEVAERTLTIAMQTADLEALYRADEELERHVQLDQVLQALVDIAVDRLHADKSAVLAWDDTRDCMAIRVARNLSPNARERLTFARGEGFVGQVMATGEPITVSDAEAELRPEGTPGGPVPERAEIKEALLSEGIRSFMHIPIRLAIEGGARQSNESRPDTSPSGPDTLAFGGHGETFGIFCVCYDTPRAFGAREQRLFTALAQRAALAVQNAQHFADERRRAEQFQVIGEVSRGLISILDIKALLNEIVRLIQKTFGYDLVALALIEEGADGDVAVYRVGAGRLWDDPSFEFVPGRLKVGTKALGLRDAEGITGWVAGSGEPLLAPDVTREPRYVWLRGSSTRSELTVPLKMAGKVIGVLDAQSERLNAFDASDLAVMQSLANQAAIAIENARLYESSNRQVAQLTALQATNRAVTSTLERDALLELIMAQATTLLQSDGGLINLVDWTQQQDEVVAGSGMAAQFVGAHGLLTASLSGWVSLHNQPIISNDLDKDERVAPDVRLWLAQSHLRSAALAPLLIKDRVIGTLVLMKAEDQGGFDQGDLDLLVAFADQAAIAIENMWLYERAQQVAASQERNRLARDLHDAVTQTLFSASLIAEVLPALWENDPAEGRELLGELRQLTRGALAEMRTLLLELRPTALVEADLSDLLRQLAESVSGRTGIPVTVSLTGCPPDLPDEVHVALYRIAQETLNNVVKHSQAKHAAVHLGCSRELEGGVTAVRDAAEEKSEQEKPGRVILTIRDDGRGFDPAAVSPNHFGLGIIRERAQAIGAVLHVESQPGAGAQVTVVWDATGGA